MRAFSLLLPEEGGAARLTWHGTLRFDVLNYFVSL